MSRMKRCSLFGLTVALLAWPLLVYAQGTLRDTIRDRIRQKWLQKDSDKYGLDDSRFSIVHDGLTREYKVHLPAGYDKNRLTPAVVFLHGGGGNMSSAYIDGLDKSADTFGFILLIPAGTSEKSEKKLSWNGGRWVGGECCGQADDIGFISKMIDESIERFNIDKNRIYATGISNGGLMANRVACELAHKIAAVATVAPAALLSGCAPSRPIAIMDIHGIDDPINPFDGSDPKGAGGIVPYKRMSPGEVVNAWLDINGCSSESTPTYQVGGATCVRYGNCKDAAEVEFCKVAGMGHTWPSGSQYLQQSIVGPVSHDISFKQIWEFFERNPMPTQESQSTYSEGLNKYESLEYDDPLAKKKIIRTYIVHLPSGYKAGVPAAVVLNFHGGHGKAENSSRWIGGMDEKSDKEGFIAVYPNATSKAGVPGKEQYWNAGTQVVVEELATDTDDVGFINVLLDELERTYSIDKKRVYATGISNGAWMAYAVGCRLSHRIAAIAPVAGGMILEECNPQEPVSVMHFHGTADPGWPYNGGGSCWTNTFRRPIKETIAQWVRKDSCNPVPKETFQKGKVTCITYSPCAQGAEITFCTIKDGGHTFPGGFSSRILDLIPWDNDCALGKGRGAGEVNRDISSLDMMWEFFKKHPKQ